jgi:Co/Zn/Cd efflux system component
MLILTFYSMGIIIRAWLRFQSLSQIYNDLEYLYCSVAAHHVACVSVEALHPLRNRLPQAPAGQTLDQQDGQG